MRNPFFKNNPHTEGIPTVPMTIGYSAFSGKYSPSISNLNYAK